MPHPVSANELLAQAISAHNADDLSSAHRLCLAAVKREPKNIAALHLLGVVDALRKDTKSALRHFERALKENPNNANVLADKGKVLFELGRYQDALLCLQQSVAINSQHWLALHNQGCVLLALKRPAEALDVFDHVLRIAPDFAPALNNRGLALKDLGRLEDAVSSFEKSLVLNQHNVETLCNIGQAYLDSNNYDGAFSAYDRALVINNSFSEAWLGRGKAFSAALRYEDALADIDKALALAPDLTEAWFSRGRAFDKMKRHDEAAKAFAKGLEIEPEYPLGKGALLHQHLLCCYWTDVGKLVEEIETDINAAKVSVEPFVWQGASNSQRSLHQCSKIFAKTFFPPSDSNNTPYREKKRKIRIGYVSGEFREQATAFLLVGVLEHHDHDIYEIYAFDNGWDDSSETRKRIEASVDSIINIRGTSDSAAVATIREKEIDILVNLNGYFGEMRMRLFALRSAPIQVNYLGFPGTLGANYMDYIVGDSLVIPNRHNEFYDEKIVRLPNCYQPNDRKQQIAKIHFTREECDLPQEGFVFCCFNNTYKIMPNIFSIWMRILENVDGSVLWLFEENPVAKVNLKKEAELRGVSANRLIFAKHVQHAEHLARHRLADLFLDTLPYNAHTTASDALWVGVPLLTCIGETFAGRVAASLLNAVAMPHLVTKTLEEYERMAIELATHPKAIAQIKRELADKRLSTSLFDSANYTKHLEMAYIRMFERYNAGLSPDHIDVA